jgi:hypothetical protein
MNVFGNPSMVKNQRAFWVTSLIVGNVVVFPIYWYLYVWREPKINNQEITYT